MKAIYKNIIISLNLLLLILSASCNITQRLAEDDVLYTGVTKENFVMMDSTTTLDAGVKEAVMSALNVPANNAIMSPFHTLPIPIGLMAYTYLQPNKDYGLKYWLYNKIGQEPVLMSDVRASQRVQMVHSILANNGYFGSYGSYKVIPDKKNKKKAKIEYTINVNKEYLIDTIIYPAKKRKIDFMLDSIAHRSKYLKPGSRFCLDSLSNERVRIANDMRKKGYYFFLPEYVEYLADSTIHEGAIAMKLNLATNAPNVNLEQYKTGNVTMRIFRTHGTGDPDTITTSWGNIVQMKPSRVRISSISDCVRFEPGKNITTRDVNNTQDYLSRLGIFKSLSINIEKPDTLYTRKTVDVNIDATLDTPLEISIEANATSKSNSYLGPGLILGLNNKNIFGGGEHLAINLTGSYEWQTGVGRSSVLNSYELGLNTSLSFPRLLAPKFVKRNRRNISWTRFQIGGDLLNRPKYFRMLQVNGLFSYEWYTKRNISHTFTPFKLTFVKLLSMTPDFVESIIENPVTLLSFEDQFIPLMSYTIKYNKKFGDGRRNQIELRGTAMEAGNIFDGVGRLFGGKKQDKNFLGSTFSQFVKGSFEAIYSRQLFGSHSLVTRFLVGAGYAYGNSAEMPYSEQFYIGGANSLRAFTVRSIGPGRYCPDEDDYLGYLDHTGDFKLEWNLEYRFPIFGDLKGAGFIDTGNIWLIKEDEYYPGAELSAKHFWNDIAVGTGVGLRYDLQMLVIRADLGIGIHAPYDTGKSGYYNMKSFKESLAFHLAIGYPF